MSTVRIYDSVRGEEVEVERVDKTDEEWRAALSPNAWEITTHRGTERPGSMPYDDVHGPGLFRCVRCGTDLFSYETKFESGTGWPSFYQPVSPLNVVEQEDRSLGMVRTEVLCARCGSHLGHVFPDGPRPTGLRYCMNGYALEYVPD